MSSSMDERLEGMSSMARRFEDFLVDVGSQMLARGEAFFTVLPDTGNELTFRMIFEDPMDTLTHQLEKEGFRIWFTCEVDGVEHRLAARR